MTPVPNYAKRRLAENKLTLGMGVTLLRGSAPAMLAKANGYDFLFIDMEHAGTSVDDAGRMATAALSTGVTPIVRCCKDALYEGTRVLDNGAMGVVVPHVDTAEEARRAVSTYLYPPSGSRSVTNALPQFGFGLTTQDDAIFRSAILAMNREILVVVMIETAESIENVDAIAAVDGVDVLWIGASDLTASMDLHNQAGHPRVRAAFSRVADASRKHRKSWGMGGLSSDAIMREYYGLGARFILGCDDYGAVMAGSAARAKAIRAFETA